MSTPFERVMAAVDPTDTLATAVLETARDVAKGGARLYIISVVNDAPVAYPAPEPTAFAAIEAAWQSREDARAMERKLRDFVEREVPDAQFEAVMGGTADAVLERAEALGVDLIVVGTHQKGFWERMIEGSPSTEVVKRANAKILLAPELPPKTRTPRVRDAGPAAMRNPPRKWNEADEASDESFPASDPPAKY